MKYIGIDVAKENHKACIVDENKKKLTTFSFANSHLGLLEFKKKISKFGDEFVIGMESSGIYHHGLVEHLKKNYQISLINPKRIKAHRKSLGYESKTDKIDAYIIADYVKERQLTPNLFPEKYPRLKQLCRTRTKLVQQQTRLKNRIRGDIHILFPEYPKCFDNMFCLSSIAFLKEYLFPLEIKNLKVEDIHTALKKGWIRISLGHAKRIHDASKSSFGIIKEGVDIEIRLAIANLECLSKQIDSVENLIKQEMDHVHNPFASVKGLTIVQMGGIISESRDITYFRSRDQYYNFTGLPPRISQSGKFESKLNRMSKCGSSYLRWYLMQAARSVAMNNEYFRQIFVKKKYIEKKCNHTAYSCVAKKLCHILFKLVKENQQFCPDKLVR